MMAKKPKKPKKPSKQVQVSSTRIYSFLFVFTLTASAIYFLSASIAFAQQVQQSPELVIDPWRIVYKVAHDNLGALCLGVIVGSWLTLKQFKVLERIDGLEDNQKRMIRLSKSIALKLGVDLINSSIPDDN